MNGVICAEGRRFFLKFWVLRLEGNFDSSSGSLYRFKQRHGIRELHIQGEALSGDKDAAEKFVAEFNNFCYC